MRILVFEYLSAGGVITGGEADEELLREGLAMRDAIAHDLAGLPGVEVLGAGDDDATGPVEGMFESLRRRAGQVDRVWGVAPETDGLLQLVQVTVGDARWIGCEEGAIRIAASKRATLECLAQAGLPTPRDFAAGARYWVVKPDDGAGACDTRLHASEIAARADLHLRLERNLSATLEPWVEGEALSLSLLCDGGLAEVVSFNRQRIEVDGHGRLETRGVETQALAHDARRPALRRLAQTVAKALPGLRGFVGIDLVWHPRHGPVPIEVNPRVTSAYVGLSARLGRNLAGEVLALHGKALRATA